TDSSTLAFPLENEPGAMREDERLPSRPYRAVLRRTTFPTAWARMRALDRGGGAGAVDARTRLARALSGCAGRQPGLATEAAGFARPLEDRADPFVRERLEGHFTASAWLVDRTGSRTLLTHHRKLGRWLQPGGHADGDRDLARV